MREKYEHFYLFDINPITKSRPLTLTNEEWHLKNKSCPSEVVQYLVYNDLHFIKKWAESIIVEVDNDSDDREIVSLIEQHVQSCVDAAVGHAYVWLVTKGKGTKELLSSHDRRFRIHISLKDDESILKHVLPKICKHHVLFHIMNPKCPNKYLKNYVTSPQDNSIYVGVYHDSYCIQIYSDKYEQIYKQHGFDKFINLVALDKDDDTKSANYLVTKKDHFQNPPSYFITDVAKDCLKYLWDQHLTTSNNNQNNDDKLSMINYIDFIQRYRYIRRNDINNIACSSNNQDKGCWSVIAIDNRPNFLTVWSLELACINIDRNDDRWRNKPLLFTSKNAMSFYEKHCDWATIVHDPSLDVARFHIDVYNDLLTSDAFWERLENDYHISKVLIVQDDGVLLRKGVEKFMADETIQYIGAPWSTTEMTDVRVGNGGVSIRTVKAIREVIEKYGIEDRNALFFFNLIRTPEDVLFSRRLATTIDVNVAKQFASEQILHPTSLAIHKPWPYHNRKEMQSFFRAILMTQQQE
jgi:hypothetical protein